MIRGIGGVFIYADDAKALVTWYARHFGIEFQYESSEGSYCRHFVLPQDPAYNHTEREVFAIRQAKQPRTDASRRFVINLRVDDLRELLHELRNNGVPVDRTRDHDYGKFAWDRDPEGNLIELFEAV